MGCSMSTINIEHFNQLFTQLHKIVHADIPVDEKHHIIFYNGLAHDICEAGLIVREEISSCNLTEIDVFYNQCKKKMTYLGGE